MAVIKNDKTGCWEVRTYYKDILGNRKQKTKRGFEKKSEALEWERNFKLQKDNSLDMTFIGPTADEVFTFSNAKEFYKKLQVILPDLVVLDVMLPDESGNEIIKKLRSQAETRRIPVIMVTAKTSEMDLVRRI